MPFVMLACGLFFFLLQTGCQGVREGKVYDAPAVEASSRTSINTLVVPGQSVGGVPFSVTRKEIFAMFGEPERMFFGDRRFASGESPSDAYCVYASRGISVLFHEEEVRSVSWITESYATREGLHVGSTMADATALWGPSLRQWMDSGKNLLAYEKSLAILEVDAKKGYILGMTLLSPSWAQAVGFNIRERAPLAPTTQFTDNRGQEVLDRRQDFDLLRDTGIDLDEYGYSSGNGSDYAVHTYLLRNWADEAVRGQSKQLVSTIDSLHSRMPSVKDVVKEFGPPPMIDIAVAQSIRLINLYYGESLPFYYIHLFYGNQSAKLIEIRLRRAISGYRFRGRLEVGSPFDEVFAVLGEPLETVAGTSTVFRDRIFSEATLEGGDKRQYIEYASEGVRFFGKDGKVTVLYLFDPISWAAGRLQSGAGAAQSSAAASSAPNGPVGAFADVRSRDMSGYGDRFSEELIRTLTFNETTVFPPKAAETAKRIMDEGMNPGLGVRALHARGITGKGVSVAVIDQYLVLDQAEYMAKVAAYKDMGTGVSADRGSMRGPAVLSLLVSDSMGTAPGARVWYAAASSAGARHLADALLWVIEENRKLPADRKICIVSVSANPSGERSPWDDAVKLAGAEGMLVLDGTADLGFIGPCYYDPGDPENTSKCTAGFPGWAKGSYGSLVLAPASFRTQFEEYEAGQPGRQYSGRGASYISYAAGVLAMGWQVNPALDADAMVKLLRESAAKLPDGSLIIDPPAFIAAVEKTAGR